MFFFWGGQATLKHARGAGMLCAAEEAQLLRLILKLMGAKKAIEVGKLLLINGTIHPKQKQKCLKVYMYVTRSATGCYSDLIFP